MTNIGFVALAIFAMASITYLIRAIPFFLIKEPIKSPFLQSFFYYIPYSVLAGMTFPTIFFSTGNLFAGIFATAVALFLAFKQKGLFTVIIAAVLSAYIALLITNLF